MKTGLPFYGLCVVICMAGFLFIPSGESFSPEHTRLAILASALIGILLFAFGVGLDVTKSPLGILLSGRNTYSLSRLQMALWTWLVLGGLIATAVSRAWSIGKVGTPMTALAIRIPSELLAAMGISYFTGFAAPAALALKGQTQSTPGQINLSAKRMGESICTVGSVVYRPLNAPPKIADMVQGDDLATAGTVDLSKVQQLMITLLLIGIYLVQLVGLFTSPHFTASDGTPALLGGSSDMTSLPSLQSNFVSLLALSHAGYLAYKVAPRLQAQPSAASLPALRPTPPDRMAP
jgi:hypothetical protein